MSDYSDIIYLMGAIIIFSLVSLNASHFFRVNEQFQYRSEIQYNGIAVAQDIIEDIRWISDRNRFIPGSGNCICDEYPKTITQILGTDDQYQMDYQINIELTDIDVDGSNATNTLIVVTVTNEYLSEGDFIKMEYIKSFAL